jgi:hypothetical protein
MPAELDHASSLEEAKTMLQRGHYGLVLFEHEMGGAARCETAGGVSADRVYGAVSSCSPNSQMRKPSPT